MSVRLACLLLLSIAACRGGAPSGSDSAPDPRPTAQVSDATQRDLAHELDATEHAEDPALALEQLRQRWLHRALTWTVLVQRPLCATEAACHVVPFPAPRAPDVSAQGWLPALAFAPGEYARLAAACGDAPACSITFTGELADFEVSTEEPTRLGFASVRVVTATAGLAAVQQPGG